MKPPPYEVLLVEVTMDQVLPLRSLLEKEAGCKVTLAQEGIRGCQLAEAEEWDLVITDLNLPGKDGMDVIRASKESSPDTPVLATTAYGAPHYLDQAHRAGADVVLEKPLDREALLASVLRLVGPPDPKHEAPTVLEQQRARAAADTVVAVGALPGDVELGCGGLLLRHKARGHRVVILHLTSGEEGTDSSRKEDAQEAAQVLGAHLVIGDTFGERVPDAREMMSLVQRTVEDFQPLTVYAPSGNDVRESRLNTHQAASQAAREVPNLLCYQAPSTTLDFKPTLFVDVTEFLDTKLESLKRYRSQVETRPHLDRELIRATARYWGRYLGYTLAEPLEVVRGRGAG